MEGSKNHVRVKPTELQPYASSVVAEARQQMGEGEATPVPDDAWKLTGINWTFLALNLPWAHVLVTFLLTVVPAIVVHVTVMPRTRPFRVYDATISYPLMPDTIPAWAAFVVPLVVFFLTILVVELWIHSGHNACLTNCFSNAIYFFIDCLCAFSTVNLVTEVSKREVGFLRPYFLSACKPLPPELPATAQLGFAASPICSVLDRYTTDDGRVSFPSGHSSVSAVIQFYNAGYCLWSLALRFQEPCFMDAFSWHHLFLRDFFNILAIFWILAMQTMAWIIMLSRIIDFRHHPADALGGFVLGAIVSIVWVVTSISSFKYRPTFCCRTKTAIFQRWRPLKESAPSSRPAIGGLV